MRLWTAGYEGDSLDDFLARLATQSAAQRLVDVREMPASRKRGFSRTALATALAGAGYAYQHLRALGCPKAIRDRHRQDGDWARYTRDFLAHLDTQGDVLASLATSSMSTPTVLLCFERDFNRCHRTYVARAIARLNGARIVHLTPDGPVRDGDRGGEG